MQSPGRGGVPIAKQPAAHGEGLAEYLFRGRPVALDAQELGQVVEVVGDGGMLIAQARAVPGEDFAKVSFSFRHLLALTHQGSSQVLADLQRRWIEITEQIAADCQCLAV